MRREPLGGFRGLRYAERVSSLEVESQRLVPRPGNVLRCGSVTFGFDPHGVVVMWKPKRELAAFVYLGNEETTVPAKSLSSCGGMD